MENCPVNALAMVSQILLWIGFAVLAILIAALARQIGVLHERIAPAGALTLHQTLKPGEQAPNLRLETLGGREVTIGGARSGRGQLIFFLSPDCPLCKSMLPVLKSAAKAERRWIDIVLASDGDAAGQSRFVAREELEGFDYVLSEPLGRTLGVSKLPYAILIDENGLIASMGLVNNREHLESLFEAKERGVTSIQEFMASR